jgi:hypothetical protein
MTVQTRPVNRHDTPFLIELLRADRAAEMAATSWTLDQKQTFINEQFRFQRASYAERYTELGHSIITQQGTPVGRFWFSRKDQDWRLVDLLLLPPHRDLGHEETVLRPFLQDADTAGQRIFAHAFHHDIATIERLRNFAFETTGMTDSRVSLVRPVRAAILR